MGVLHLLPTDFPRCECGHLRVHHDEDHIVQGTGRCEVEKCRCRFFVAEDTEVRKERN